VGRVPNSTEDLAEAELALQRAVLHSDTAALEHLLDDEAELTGPDGVRVGKDEDIERYRSGQLRIERFEVERTRVRVMEELGLSFLTATLAGSSGGDPFQQRLRITRTWRLGEEWALVASHASIVRE
jgi:hypothetical protein